MAATTSPDLRGKLEQVNEEIAQKRGAAQAAWKTFEEVRDEFAKAGNEANRTDSEEFKKAEEHHRKFAELSDELKQVEAVRDGIFGMLGKDAPTFEPDKPTADKPDRDVKSLGERAVESAEYKALVESGVLNSERASFGGDIALGKRGSIEEAKALITGVSTTSGGAFVDPMRAPYVGQPMRRRSILDLITTGQTNSDSVRFARQTTFTNVAAETAEATATSTGTKPEATIAFEVVNDSVKNIAHWVPATRRSLRTSGSCGRSSSRSSPTASSTGWRARSSVVTGQART
jgi:HK97 family phage major capsid protein